MRRDSGAGGATSAVAPFFCNYSAQKTASGGKVSHLESRLRMRFAPSFLGANRIRL